MKEDQVKLEKTSNEISVLAPPEAFDEPVKELQKQENDIKQKIAHINKRLESMPKNSQGREKMEYQVKKAEKKLNDLIPKVTGLKIEDLEKELEQLKKFIRNPEKARPAPTQGGKDGGNGGGGSGSGNGGKKPSPGLFSLNSIEPISHVRHKTELQKRDFIVVRDGNTVWVWNPFKQKWDAKLETGDDIKKMKKIDGTIAVYTTNYLWLFNPIEYSWIGKLKVKVAEISAFTIEVPVIVKV
ncbi:MAG: hypothetical protein MI974_30960 [Chitinophagales bacterium]|nr:hypothetical protein [Chitinophagales bacterium]